MKFNYHNLIFSESLSEIDKIEYGITNENREHIQLSSEWLKFKNPLQNSINFFMYSIIAA
jgi:hypothetical protein